MKTFKGFLIAILLLGLGVWMAYEKGEFGRSYGGLMEQQWKQRLDNDMNTCFNIINLPADSINNPVLLKRINDYTKEINSSPPSHLNHLKSGCKLSIRFFKSYNDDIIATIGKMADDTSNHDVVKEKFRTSVNTQKIADSLNTFYHVKDIEGILDTLTGEKSTEALAFRLMFSSYLTLDSTFTSQSDTTYNKQLKIYRILFSKN